MRHCETFHGRHPRPRTVALGGRELVRYHATLLVRSIHAAPSFWPSSEHRAELFALYAEADALLEGWACSCAVPRNANPRCCHFEETGREPYPTRVELEEVFHAARSVPAASRNARRLPVARGARGARGPCPLLASDGRCSIYASRPFGCRTFFCRDAEGPTGSRSKVPRDAIGAIGRRLADLSARFSPQDPHPRPLVRALAARIR